MKLAFVYKIRRISDGEYATGGGRFNKSGKVWFNINGVKAHLRENNHKIDSIEIERYKVEQIDSLDYAQIRQEMNAAKRKREEKRAENHLMWMKENADKNYKQARENYFKQFGRYPEMG